MSDHEGTNKTPYLKPADPAEYVHLIGDLIFNTNPSVFGCLVRNDRELFRRWMTPLWLSTRCSYSHDCATACLQNGEMFGFEQGFAGELYGALEQGSSGKVDNVFSPEQLQYMGNCARHLNYVVPYIPKSAYYVHLLSVRGDRQGTGVGRMLLENAFERASASGFKSVQLDVYEGNPAVGFYEKMGMEKRLETRFPAFQRVWQIPAHYRMVRDL